MDHHLLDLAGNTLLNVTDRPGIIMDKGEGMYLSDTNGNRYLDFVGGWAVNCLGHSPDALGRALSHQAARLVNASPSYFNRPMIEFARSLTNRCCFDRVFFASSGAEANEGAIKLARKYGTLKKNGAYDIITAHNGFHGRTLTTMAATGKAAWEPLFEPKTRGFQKSVFNDISSVKSLISENTCAVMIEPVQGEGGVHAADPGYIKALRRLCSDHGILLIFDEIQTGMGRTGKWFCYEHYGVEPDIMTLGKGIGGGFPLSAMLAKEFLNIFDPGDQGGTYSSQPLAMAAGLAVLQALQDQHLVEKSRKMGRYLTDRLRELEKTHAIRHIRGMGLLIAFDLEADTGGRVVSTCLDNHLLINGVGERTIRLMPPLIVSERDIDHCVAVLGTAVARR